MLILWSLITIITSCYKWKMLCHRAVTESGEWWGFKSGETAYHIISATSISSETSKSQQLTRLSRYHNSHVPILSLRFYLLGYRTDGNEVIFISLHENFTTWEIPNSFKKIYIWKREIFLLKTIAIFSLFPNARNSVSCLVYSFHFPW